MSLGVVAERAWCFGLAGCYFLFVSGRKGLFDAQDRGRRCARGRAGIA
jgi:hypothetical protein